MAQKDTFIKQLDLLQNNYFQICLIDRKTEEKKGFLYSKGKKTEFSKEELINFYQSFKNFNNSIKRYDIYISATNSNQNKFYNLVIDDLTPENVKKLVKSISVAYVALSSANNYQAIINLNKEEYSKEEANFIVHYINTRLGDEKIFGAIRTFRAVSFYNRKKKNNDEMCHFIELKDFELAAEEESKKNLSKILHLMKTSSKKTPDATKINDEDKNLDEAKKIVFKVVATCKRIFSHRLDYSVIDFRIMKELIKKDFNKETIKKVMLSCTDCQKRHLNTEDYLERTFKKALIELKEKS